MSVKNKWFGYNLFRSEDFKLCWPKQHHGFMLTVFLNLSDLLIPNQPEDMYVLDEQVFISLSVKRKVPKCQAWGQ